jgi:hypothetical protein
VIEEPNAVRKEPAEATGERCRDEEVPDAEGDLALRIEKGEVDGKAWEETAFYGAEEQAACDEGAVGVAETGQRRDYAPGGGDEGDPAGGAELFDDEVGGESGG